MSNTNDLSNRTLTLERTFDAPLALVWEAWTKPKHITHWWGPKGMPVKIAQHDFRVGGHWKYIMPFPDGSEFIGEGTYSEIVEFKKTVTSADFKPMTEGVEMTMLFEELGDKTKFTFKVLHKTEEYKLQQEKMGFYNGWGTVFEGLNSYLIKKQ